jgi:hypothetical protein
VSSQRFFSDEIGIGVRAFHISARCAGPSHCS